MYFLRDNLQVLQLVQQKAAKNLDSNFHWPYMARPKSIDQVGTNPFIAWRPDTGLLWWGSNLEVLNTQNSHKLSSEPTSKQVWEIISGSMSTLIFSSAEKSPHALQIDEFSVPSCHTLVIPGLLLHRDLEVLPTVLVMTMHKSKFLQGSILKLQVYQRMNI